MRGHSQDGGMEPMLGGQQDYRYFTENWIVQMLLTIDFADASTGPCRSDASH